jgi:alpha-L-rhamnosidase
MRERFGPMLARGATTLWESFEPTASLCHGFSASPTYQLSRRVLGVSPGAAGWGSVIVASDLAGLDFAEGVVPTTGGDVEVRLQKTADGFHARVKGPEGLPLWLVAAPGMTFAGAVPNVDGVSEGAFRR